MLDYLNDAYDPMPIVNKIVDVDIRVNINNIYKYIFSEFFLCRQWLQV
jgi:hypothetical protein